jgi:PKD repeat protein
MRAILLWAALLSLVPGMGQAATYYVRASASAGHSCGQAQTDNDANAMNSIQAGINCVTGPGDVVIVHGGTYGSYGQNLNIPSVSGSDLGAGAITLRAATGETVWNRGILDSSSSTGEYWIIDGINLDGGFWPNNCAGVPGDVACRTVVMVGCSHCRYQNFEAKNASYYGIAMAGHSEYINVRSHDHGTSSNSLCGGNPEAGGQCHGFYTHEANVVLDRVESYNNNGNGIALTLGANAITVKNSKIHNNIYSMQLAYAGNNHSIYNNAIYDNAAALHIFSSGSSVFYNNTLYQNGGGIDLVEGSSNNTLRNNIIYSNGSTIVDQGSNNVQSNNLTTNPFFANAPAHDFHLTAASTDAIDQGFNLAFLFTTDLEGQPRVVPFDIGAYEFVGAQPPAFAFSGPSSVPSGEQPSLTWSAVSSQGIGLTCAASVIAGGSDSLWTSTSPTSAQLTAGGSRAVSALTASRTYRMSCTDSNGTTNHDVAVSVVPACARIRYGGGTPWAIPGTVEVENFDSCSNLGGGVTGEGTTHHDLDSANNGGAYRLNEDVDIIATGAASNGHRVGYVQAGEWLEHTVSVAATATYQFSAYVSYGSTGSGGTFHLSVDGSNVSGTMTVPNTGSWDVFTQVSVNIPLTAGAHTVRLSVDAAGGDGENVGDFDRLVFTTVGTGQVAVFTGTPLSGAVPLAVTFTDASTGTITSRAWTFGDGGTSTATNPSHTYTSVGTYTVALTVTGPGGSDTLTRTGYITVTAAPTVHNLLKLPFDEGTGLNAVSTSVDNATPHTCVLNAASWGAPIIGNFALNADGSHYCSMPCTADLRPANTLSITAWINGPPANGNYGNLVNCGERYVLSHEGDGTLRFSINQFAVEVAAPVASQFLTNTNQMVGATKDATGLRLWIGTGQLAAFTPTTAPITYSGNETLYVGRRALADEGYVIGRIDQVYIDDTALNQNTINTRFNESGTPQGLSQAHMRYYADAVEGTPLAAVDSNLPIVLGATFVMRFAISNVGPDVNQYFPLWCNRNNAGWLKMTNSFGSTGLRIATSNFANMGDLTTVPLPDPNGMPLDGLAPIRGRMVADVIDPSVRTQMSSGQRTEWAYYVETGAPAVVNDTLVCEPRQEDDSEFPSYSNLKTVTLLPAAPPSDVWTGGIAGGIIQ